MGKKVGVSQEEKNLSYYKFFERPMAEIPEEKLALLEGQGDRKPGVPFEKETSILPGMMKHTARAAMVSMKMVLATYAIPPTCPESQERCWIGGSRGIV